MISMELLRDARCVLSPVINLTPMIPAKGFVPDCRFYLKADCLQKTGAFKLRGAYYKLSTLTDEEKEDLDEAAQLESISHMPARVKCAELGWRTLSEIIGE